MCRKCGFWRLSTFYMPALNVRHNFLSTDRTYWLLSLTWYISAVNYWFQDHFVTWLDCLSFLIDQKVFQGLFNQIIENIFQVVKIDKTDFKGWMEKTIVFVDRGGEEGIFVLVFWYCYLSFYNWYHLVYTNGGHMCVL